MWYPDLIQNLNKLLEVVKASHISLDFGKDMYLGLPGRINGNDNTHLNTIPFCQKMKKECQSLKIISMYGSSFFKVINSFTALNSLRLEGNLMFTSDIDLSGAQNLAALDVRGVITFRPQADSWESFKIKKDTLKVI